MNVHNKLECFSLADLSSLVRYLWARSEPTRVEHLSGAQLLGRLVALPINIWLGCMGLLGTFVNYDCTKFYIFMPKGQYYKNLPIRNVRQMDRFCNKLVPYIVGHHHTIFYKHTSLLQNPSKQICNFYSTGQRSVCHRQFLPS
jgi:hypothetical protein